MEPRPTSEPKEKWHSTWFKAMNTFLLQKLNVDKTSPHYEEIKKNAPTLVEIEHHTAQIINNLNNHQSRIDADANYLRETIRYLSGLNNEKSKGISDLHSGQVSKAENEAKGLSRQRKELIEQISQYKKDVIQIESDIKAKGSSPEIISKLNNLIQQGEDLNERIKKLNKDDRNLQSELTAVTNKITVDMKNARIAAPTAAPGEGLKPT